MEIAICRLCLAKNKEFINIFGEEGSRHNVQAIVGQHFWFQIEENDGGSKQICMICWQKIENFHLFYTHIGDIHKSFSQQSSFDKQIVKLETDEDSASIAEVKIETNEASDVSVKLDLIDFFDENSNDSDGNEYVPDLGSDESEEEEDEEEDLKKPIPKLTRKRTTRMNKKDESNSDIEIEENPSRKVKGTRGTGAKRTKKQHRTKEELAEDKKAKELRREQFRADNEKIGQFCKMKCDLCTEVFEDLLGAKRHYQKSHNMEGYLMCCDRKFYKRVNIMSHIRRHIDPDAHKCELCDKSFRDKKSLISHMENTHPTDKPTFQCDSCPKMYYTHYRLQFHKRCHGERSHCCKECGKTFHTNARLRFHVRAEHENAYLQICEICAKSFKTKVNFQHHMRHVHATVPDPKVQCQQCGAWLKHENSLRRHMRKHKDVDKLHICNLCGKSCLNKDSLKRHISFVHSMERSYVCEFCDKAFKRALTLREHMTTHTGEVLYTCPFCPKTFNSSANMHAHKKKIHPIEWAENKNKD